MFPDWRLQDRNPGTFVSYPLHLQTISGLRTVAVTKDAIAPGMIVAVIVRETCRDSTLASSILEASSNGKVVSGGYIEDHRAPSERNFGPLQKVAICVKERPHLILVVNASGFLAAPIYVRCAVDLLTVANRLTRLTTDVASKTSRTMSSMNISVSLTRETKTYKALLLRKP